MGIVQKKGEDLAFAACFNCRRVYTYTSASGTSSMTKYSCPENVTGKGNMNLFVTKKSPVRAGNDKKKLTQALANFVPRI
jgi:hypothetical protein